jgi:UDP-N-acetylglucosamine 2-epimerase (non-hydrolysing)
MKILNIVGARPNFMKVAPLHRAFTERSRSDNVISKIVHTGQHYDQKMSDVFFRQLELPEPHYFLGIGGGSHAEQTAKIMLEFEKVLREEAPDLVLVVGDVNSTVACSLVAVKEHVKVAHVEAGLRSFDRRMPEEINRLVTDELSDFLFVTEQSGMENLKREGASEGSVFFVGNVMIDSLIHFLEKSRDSNVRQALGIQDRRYVLMTMHRPSNVDEESGLRSIAAIIDDASVDHTVVFPVHPRTRKNLERFGLLEELERRGSLVMCEPQGYLEFLHLMEHAHAVVTDSGGIQEETTYLGVPCLTFRDTTERPCTVDIGTNVLIKDLNPEAVRHHLDAIGRGEFKRGEVPPLWDGKASHRIVDVLLTEMRRS